MKTSILTRINNYDHKQWANDFLEAVGMSEAHRLLSLPPEQGISLIAEELFTTYGGVVPQKKVLVLAIRNYIELDQRISQQYWC